MSAADIKSEIRDLYITGAKQVRVSLARRPRYSLSREGVPSFHWCPARSYCCIAVMHFCTAHTHILAARNNHVHGGIDSSSDWYVGTAVVNMYDSNCACWPYNCFRWCTCRTSRQLGGGVLTILARQRPRTGISCFTETVDLLLV